MMTAVAWVALLVAGVAIVMLRRQGRRLDQVTEMYWQLKYEQGELKASLAPPPDQPPPASTAFVPLGAVKRPRS